MRQYELDKVVDVLYCYLFNNLKELGHVTEELITVYIQERLHDSVNDFNPMGYKKQVISANELS